MWNTQLHVSYMICLNGTKSRCRGWEGSRKQVWWRRAPARGGGWGGGVASLYKILERKKNYSFAFVIWGRHKFVMYVGVVVFCGGAGMWLLPARRLCGFVKIFD